MIARIKIKFKRIFPFIVIAALLVGGFIYFKFKNGITKVSVDKAEVRSISKTITASGETNVSDELAVRALISGSVKNVKFKSGEQVKKGDKVVEMDKASLKASLDTSYSTYLAAKADADSYDQSLTAAKATESVRKRERDEAWREYMSDDGEYNKQAYKNAEALYQTALSTLTSLEDNKEATKNTAYSTYSSYYSALNNYQNSTITAPSDGQLALHDIYQGSYVTAGQKLFSITNSKNLVFKAEVDEADINGLKVGMKTKISLDSYYDKTFTGTVQNIDAKVVTLDNDSTAIITDIYFDNEEVIPVVGLNGSADIEMGKSDEILSVIPDVVLEESNKNYVFVVQQDTVHKKEVQISFEGDDYVGITGDVSSGDLMVIDPGSLKLIDGQKVKL